MLLCCYYVALTISWGFSSHSVYPTKYIYISRYDVIGGSIHMIHNMYLQYNL